MWYKPWHRGLLLAHGINLNCYLTIIWLIYKEFSNFKKFWHFPILTLSRSDTFQFWHFPILTLSNSDTFQFRHFPILTLSNFEEKCILTLSNSDTFQSLWSGGSKIVKRPIGREADKTAKSFHSCRKKKKWEHMHDLKKCCFEWKWKYL